MNNIELCVIGRTTPAFTSHLNSIRRISGLKVVKRRNKPFYDVRGSLDSDAAFRAMCNELSFLITNCEAEIEITDKTLQERIVTVL